MVQTGAIMTQNVIPVISVQPILYQLPYGAKKSSDCFFDNLSIDYTVPYLLGSFWVNGVLLTAIDPVDLLFRHVGLQIIATVAIYSMFECFFHDIPKSRRSSFGVL